MLAYYSKRPVLMLQNQKGSILHFIEKDRQALCIDESQLEGLANGPHAVYLVGVTQKTIARLTRLQLPYRIVAASGNRTLFALHPGS